VVARVAYDGERTDEISSPELRVRATPEFANAIGGLPFGLDGLVGPALGAPRQLNELRFVELPPATPIADRNGAARAVGSMRYAALESAQEPGEGARVLGLVGTIESFGADRLARTLRFLEEAAFGGTISHLFAQRALLPEALGDSHFAALEALRELLRRQFDRLFIKLRLPDYAIAARDVETPSLRATIERVVHDAADARGTPAEPPGAALILRGSFDPAEMTEFAERLRMAPEVTALPWAALARLLPDGAPEQRRYRDALASHLDALSDLECDEFLDALQQHGDPELDAALHELRTGLSLNRTPA
jgi:hypothetical protein